MARLAAALSDHTVIGIDTPIFIYHFEANSAYLSLTTDLLNGIQAGQWQAVTSIITLMEINVHPWRMEQSTIAQTYETLLVNFPYLKIVDIDRDIARRAAQIRATYNLRPADAIHIATALHNGATAWVSNDRQHERLAEEIAVMLLDDYAA